MALTTDGGTLLVACADAQQLLWIDLDSEAVTTRLRLPRRPTGLAVDTRGERIYVTTAGPRGTVTVVDARARQVRDRIAVGYTAMAPVLAPDATRLYVCNRFDHDLSVIDLEHGEQIARLPVVREPVAAAITPNGHQLVVANLLPHEPADGYLVRAAVSLINTSTLTVQNVALFDGATGLRGVSVSPDGRFAVVAHVLSNYDIIASHLDEGWMNANSLSFVDLQSAQTTGNALLDDRYLAAANPWDVRLSSDGESVFVTHAGSHELSIIPTTALWEGVYWGHDFRGPFSGDNRAMRHRRRVPLPGQGPRAMVVDDSRVFIAEYYSDTISVVQHASGAEPTVRTIRLGPPVRPTLQRRGEMLFHDGRLCYQQWQSCASCHPDGRADALNWDLLNDGAGNRKNTKSLLLAHQTPPAMVRGVRDSAETAVRSGMHHILFAEPDEDAALAIDAYLKSLRPLPSPYLVEDQPSQSAVRGQQVFERVGCARCHPAPLYTDLQLHSMGPRDIDGSRQYDTPTLIEAWRTAPYRHDGHFVNLREMLSEGHHGLGETQLEDLSPRELGDLVEFVLSL